MNAASAAAEDLDSSSAEVWHVLAVDDDEGVLAVTRLTLRGLSFEGREILLHCAQSAAEAREMLKRIPDIAVILLDVVMETEDAGLALVDHVRQGLRNFTTRIILRTGQPGLAPPLDLIRRHEIDGYCAKTDLSSMDLKMIVLANLRTARLLRALQSGLPSP